MAKESLLSIAWRGEDSGRRHSQPVPPRWGIQCSGEYFIFWLWARCLNGSLWSHNVKQDLDQKPQRCHLRQVSTALTTGAIPAERWEAWESLLPWGTSISGSEHLWAVLGPAQVTLQTYPKLEAKKEAEVNPLSLKHTRGWTSAGFKSNHIQQHQKAEDVPQFLRQSWGTHLIAK